MADLNDYDYTLPRELIAQQPAANRDAARLLVVDRQRQALSHWRVRDLPELLRPADCLVLNESRVVPARLVGRRAKTGGRWHGLFVEADAAGHWVLVCKARGRLQPGEWIELAAPQARDDLRLQLVERLADGSWRAHPEIDGPPYDILERVGYTPLPDYIRGGARQPADAARYQTVYAATPGSVAAPTAGLHFTHELLEQLQARGLATARVTLHVGLGTFRPIRAATLDAHTMHREWARVPTEAVELIDARRAAGGRSIAVGTTSVRALESAAALTGTLQPWEGQTELFIRPGHTFRAVDALLTNFHLPRTTLLVLVSTFGGLELIRRAYTEAIRERYRFYSYGDAMLIV
ncbi:MAG: tRNA preQ1(34) S-adenosylmethionine ribosyltransferase-isomerase QueA [Pirellulales bacterium]|nr:tRNA preQ1(34) S-adenosylmethionine ribosyltransferase-isomerase QueA [Pirellulales bacterium]